MRGLVVLGRSLVTGAPPEGASLLVELVEVLRLALLGRDAAPVRALPALGRPRPGRAGGSSRGVGRRLAALRRAHQGTAELRGESASILALLEQLVQLAPTNYTVLLQGDTGTGKELAARLLHRLSPRASGPFETVDCSSIPRELIESELFGHAKGAFTGATREFRGAFERANGGTLLLDEIGDMEPRSQTRLLRVLQEGTVRRLGADRPVPVDVRVVAATNRDLAGLVRAGLFREDLYYRIHVCMLEMPPLRARGDDRWVLYESFMRDHARELGRRPRQLGGAARRRLRQETFPRQCPAGAERRAAAPGAGGGEGSRKPGGARGGAAAHRGLTAPRSGRGGRCERGRSRPRPIQGGAPAWRSGRGAGRRARAAGGGRAPGLGWRSGGDSRGGEPGDRRLGRGAAAPAPLQPAGGFSSPARPQARGRASGGCPRPRPGSARLLPVRRDRPLARAAELRFGRRRARTRRRAALAGAGAAARGGISRPARAAGGGAPARRCPGSGHASQRSTAPSCTPCWGPWCRGASVPQRPESNAGKLPWELPRRPEWGGRPAPLGPNRQPPSPGGRAAGRGRAVRRVLPARPEPSTRGSRVPEGRSLRGLREPVAASGAPGRGRPFRGAPTAAVATVCDPPGGSAGPVPPTPRCRNVVD